jgi:prepilin-type N-terminal cleavage/methylation domain-containing protein
MTRRRMSLARRARSGMTLIEVVVACTLLAITLTGLTGVAIRMGERSRNTAIVEQRTAVFFQEVNRLESLPYDSISPLPPTPARFLKTDSVKAGKGWSVWSYSIGAEVTNSSGGVLPYRDITLTVTPRLAPTSKQIGVIRRSKTPFVNPLNTGP